tara:strand:+ start:6409 stop:7368 length:960 start_codon:yes stop_codon:yes gene_type:complete
MKILNRWGKNILTTKMLGISAEQIDTLKTMLKSIGEVYRFVGVPNMTKKNSVRQHTAQLTKMADFVAETLDDEQDQQKLRLMAIVHDMGEICGELTVVHDDLNGEKLISPKQKNIVEFEIFKTFYKLAQAKSTSYESALDSLRNFGDWNEVLRAVQEIGLGFSNTDEDLQLFKVYQGRDMNPMLPVFLRCMDRAEGTYFFTKFAEDVDLTEKEFMQKAVEYNMASVYKGLPKNLGDREDYINTFKKVKAIVKAVVRRYKHLCRFDRLSFLDTMFNWGVYVTWGKHEFTYYIKYWNLTDVMKIISGEYKVYKSLEEIYND